MVVVLFNQSYPKFYSQVKSIEEKNMELYKFMYILEKNFLGFDVTVSYFSIICLIKRAKGGEGQEKIKNRKLVKGITLSPISHS